MTSLSIVELKALQDFLIFGSLFLSVFGLMALHMLYFLIDKYLFRRLRIPKKIPTEFGTLHRSLSGIYVKQENLKDADLDYLDKNRERSIKILEYRLNRLKK